MNTIKFMQQITFLIILGITLSVQASSEEDILSVAENLGVSREELFVMMTEQEISEAAVNLRIISLQGAEPVDETPDPIVNEIHLRAERAKDPLHEFLTEKAIIPYTDDRLVLKTISTHLKKYFRSAFKTVNEINMQLMRTGDHIHLDSQTYKKDHTKLLSAYMKYVSKHRQEGDGKVEERRLERYYLTREGMDMSVHFLFIGLSPEERTLLENQINTLATFMIFSKQAPKANLHVQLFQNHKQNVIQLLSDEINFMIMKKDLDHKLASKIDVANSDCPFQKLKKQMDWRLKEIAKAIDMYTVIVKILRASDYFNDQFFTRLKAYLPFVELIGDTVEEKNKKMETWLTSSFGESSIAYDEEVLEKRISCEEGIVDRLITGLKYLDPELDDRVFNVFGEMVSEGKSMFERGFQTTSFSVAENVYALFVRHKPEMSKKRKIDLETISIPQAKRTWRTIQRKRLYNIIPLLPEDEEIPEHLRAQIIQFREDISKDVPQDEKLKKWKETQMKYLNDILDDETIMDWGKIVEFFHIQSL